MKLSYKNEMLLTLMRLQLGLLNQDLADRFQISPTICSNTFTTWIKLMRKILQCRIIIDCTEIFIETPKSLINKASTWSDYKHHNTVKFL